MTNQQDLPTNEPLDIVAVSGPAEAQMIEELLNNNGIECSLQGDVVSTPWPTESDLDEVRVFVKRSDVERAKELVEGYFTPVGKDELVEDKADLGVDDPDEPSGFTI
jgi:putative signal transducing protein